MHATNEWHALTVPQASVKGRLEIFVQIGSYRKGFDSLPPEPSSNVNTVHWDGAKAGGRPVVLEIVGDGPVANINVDEAGKPIGKSF